MCIKGGLGRYIGRYIGRDIDRLSTDYRPAIDRLSVDYRSTIGQLSVDSRLIYRPLLREIYKEPPLISYRKG